MPAYCYADESDEEAYLDHGMSAESSFPRSHSAVDFT